MSGHSSEPTLVVPAALVEPVSPPGRKVPSVVLQDDSPVLPFTFDLLAELAVARAGAAAAAVAAKHLSGAFRVVASSGELAARLGTAVDDSTGICEACLATGESQVCQDASKNGEIWGDARRACGARSVAVVGIPFGGRVLGLLIVYSPSPNHFGTQQVQALEQLVRESLPQAGWDDELPNITPEPSDNLALDPPPLFFESGMAEIPEYDEESEKKKEWARYPVSMAMLALSMLVFCVAIGFVLTRYGADVMAQARPFIPPQLLGVLGASPPAAVSTPTDQTTIQGVSYTTLAAGTRVTIALDRELKYRSGRIMSPDSVWFDLYESRLSPEAPVQVLVRNSRVVDRIEMEKQMDRVVRVTIYLRRNARHQAQYLSSPPRLEVTLR